MRMIFFQLDVVPNFNREFIDSIYLENLGIAAIPERRRVSKRFFERGSRSRFISDLTCKYESKHHDEIVVYSPELGKRMTKYPILCEIKNRGRVVVS